MTEKGNSASASAVSSAAAPAAAASAQAGIWTLTAPDGRTWQADSPLKCAGKERMDRVSPEVAAQRMMEAIWEAEREGDITLTGHQLKAALEFVAPDCMRKAPLMVRVRFFLRHFFHPDYRRSTKEMAEEQMETEVVIGHTIGGQPVHDAETPGEVTMQGYYCWLAEYPEEGSIYLGK